MMKDIQFGAGSDILKCLADMYHETLIDEIPRTSNFNGVRVVIFYDGGQTEHRKKENIENVRKLSAITNMVKCTDSDSSTMADIADVLGVEL